MSDWDPLTGSLQFVGGLINGWQQRKSVKDTNRTNLQIARETNEAQLNAMREQNEFNAAQSQLAWDRETLYNNPTAQLKRMRAAGLNPYAGTSAGQQISGNNTGDYAAAQGAAVPALHAPMMQAPPTVLGTAFQNFSLLAGAFKTLAEAKKVGVDTKLLQDMSEDLLKEQSNKVKLQDQEQALKQLDLDFLPKKYQAELDQITQAIAVAVQTEKNLVKQGENIEADTFYKRVQSRLAKMNIKLTRRELKKIDEMLPYEQKLYEAQAEAQRGSAAAGYASAEQSREQAQTIRETRDLQIQDLTESINNKQFERAATIVQAIMKANGVGEAPWTAIYNGVVQWSKRHPITNSYIDGIEDKSPQDLYREILDEIKKKK